MEYLQTKAPILMKFETWAHKVMIDYQKKFHEEPLMHMQMQGEKVPVGKKIDLSS